MSFRITVPKEDHPRLRLKLSKYSYVKLHNTKHDGHVVPPEAMGLEYDYRQVGPDEFEFTVTANPFHVDEEVLRQKIKDAIGVIA